MTQVCDEIVQLMEVNRIIGYSNAILYKKIEKRLILTVINLGFNLKFSRMRLFACIFKFFSSLLLWLDLDVLLARGNGASAQ